MEHKPKQPANFTELAWKEVETFKATQKPKVLKGSKKGKERALSVLVEDDV